MKHSDATNYKRKLQESLQDIWALDVETTGLDSRKDSITLIGVYRPEAKFTFDSVDAFVEWLTPSKRFVGHNFKFDYKMLCAASAPITEEQWTHDTELLSVAHPDRIPDTWLDGYEEERKKQNKLLPKGHSHRKARHHSLKTLAPHLLGVDPFWEDPANHNNPEYVLKDCAYTWHLLEWYAYNTTEDAAAFYTQKLLPWTKFLVKLEHLGIAFDLQEMEKRWAEEEKKRAEQETVLRRLWAPGIEKYRTNQEEALIKEYGDKRQAALDRLKNKDKAPTTIQRYNDMLDRAVDKIEPFNLGSPTQLLWMLRDYLKYDVQRLDNGEESTGASVLEMLAASGKEDIKTLLEYRESNKLCEAFFPSYKEKLHNGRIHCTLKSSSTRTGRLSSSDPNLQQVPGHLHSLFVADPGYDLIDLDQAAIEAVLIAYYTEDPILYDIVTNNGDIHGTNAKIFFGLECESRDVKKLYPFERNVTKTIGFALFYGAGWRRIEFAAMQHGVKWSERDCKERLSNFREMYRQVFDFKQKRLDPLLTRGDTILNLFGRPIKVGNSEDVYMKGFNRLIQSSASDLVLHSAFKSDKEFDEKGIDANILLLVHDEIAARSRKSQTEAALEILIRNMTNYDLRTSMGSIPLRVEYKVGDKWLK